MLNFDAQKIAEDFPILQKQVHGKRLVYLDNAATTLKPQSVVKRIADHYLFETANIHRGVHYLSEQATLHFEEVRHKIKKFIHANSTHEIIFTKGTTDSINLVAQSLGQGLLQKGDEVIITHMEHHSNIVPWQMLQNRLGIVLRVLPINDDGELVLENLSALITKKTKLISVVHISNSLGTINPVEQIIKMAHAQNILVLVDAAQSIAHKKIDVQQLDCDFLVFSGHKMFGPTGVGVLYGKEALLNQMPPVQGGGDMIASVTFEKTEYNTLPYKFEAGTPHIAGVIGLGAAIDYINALGLENIEAYEDQLLKKATTALLQIPGLTLIGTAAKKSAIISFVLKDIHPHDIGTLVDQHGVAIRTGHHCTQPVMQRFGIPATARASFSIYNTADDIKILVEALQKTIAVFL